MGWGACHGVTDELALGQQAWLPLISPQKSCLLLLLLPWQDYFPVSPWQSNGISLWLEKVLAWWGCILSSSCCQACSSGLGTFYFCINTEPGVTPRFSLWFLNMVSMAVFILIVVKPAAFLMARKQSVTSGACTRTLKYRCAGVNWDTGLMKLMETKCPWCLKTINRLPLC